MLPEEGLNAVRDFDGYVVMNVIECSLKNNVDGMSPCTLLTLHSVSFVRALKGGIAVVLSVLSELGDFFRTKDIDDAVCARMILIVEEVLTNIVVHGYGVQEEGIIEIYSDLLQESLWVTIVDYAPFYNPLVAPESNCAANLQDREPGGLGVHFLKKMADWVVYRRVLYKGSWTNQIDVGKKIK